MRGPLLRSTDSNRLYSMLAILLLAAEKSRATFMAPLPIGLALFVAELASGTFACESLPDFPLSPSLSRLF
jgi:aquaporin related protein